MPATLLEHMRAITDAITSADLPHSNEYDLQAGIAAVLGQGAIAVRREVLLGSIHDRIDLIVDVTAEHEGTVLTPAHIGIEVKVDGTWSQVARQLQRYAARPELDALMLVTTRSRHHRIPFEMGGKPLRLVSLVGGGL